MSKFTKLERQYVKGIVQNLSLQRFSDSEIVDWLRTEKKIELDRSTVSKIRNQAEKEAESWYDELRESGARYIALYKERLDSLLSYQKKLHELMNKNPNPELVIRAISELHRIELSLHTLMKELPGDITTSKDKDIAKQDNKVHDWNESLNGPRLKTFAEWYENVRELGLMTHEIGRMQYDAYVKEWNNGMFGFDSLPPKSIVRESPSEEPGPDSECSSWRPESDFISRRTETDAQVQTDTETGIVVQPLHKSESALKLRERKPQQQKQGKPQLSTEVSIGNESGREPEELEEEETIIIKGPGQKHALGIHCTQCHGIYLNLYSYNNHEPCMQQVGGFT
jgi:hypothetical protein